MKYKRLCEGQWAPTSALLLALLCSLSSHAQLDLDAGISDMQLNQMSLQAKKIEQCMASISEQDLEALEARGVQLQADVQALCESGKRDAAQAAAIAGAKEFHDNAVLQRLRECTSGLSQMMAGLMPASPLPGEFDQLDSEHICDGMR